MLVVYFAYAAACLTSHFLMSWNFSRVSTLIEYFSMFKHMHRLQTGR